MTVTYKGEDPEGRTANNTLGVRTYSRVFNFTTSLQTEDAWDVGSHVDSPRIGDVFHDAWCRSVTPKCVKGWTIWRVEAEYSTERELATDPTNDPAIITVDTEQFQKEADRDKDGNAVVNSAGDPFDPKYMMDDSRRIVRIKKNMSGHPSWVLSYQDMVNSDSFVIKGITYTAGQGKVQHVSIGDQQIRNGVQFVVVSLDIHLQRDGWAAKIPDTGFRELAWDGATRINIYNPASTGDADGGGERITAPVPLNGSGQALTNPTAATVSILTFNLYSTAAFSALPLT